jgi:hypothetical protein
MISLVFNDNKTNFSVKFLSDPNFISYIYSKNYDFVPLPLPSRYHDHTVTVTVPLPSRYRFWVLLNTVTSQLRTIPDRYSPLPLLTVFLDKK